MKSLHFISWALRLIAAVIMLQTLYFKFSAHPESVALFTQLGVEPWGRVGTGIIELIASILILIPITTWAGAALAIGLMSGAILSHVTILGVNYGGDPLLFIYACIVWLSSLALALHEREKYTTLLKKFSGSSKLVS